MNNTFSVRRLLLTERDAAQLLGLSSRTIKLRRKSGDLPYFKVGRTVRYGRHALEEWFRRQPIAAAPATN
jgi:excisionase family DNA binding protein